MVFVPSLEFGSEDGFMELIEGIVDDAYKLSSLIPRVRLQLKVRKLCLLKQSKH